MKIAYCIAGTCHSGGMERVLANKANYLVAHGYEVIIITTDQRGESPFFPLDERIRTFDLGINYEENNGSSFWNKLIHYPEKQWKHRRRLSNLLKQERPDITISMFCNDVSFLPKIKDGSKKILEVHFSKYKRLQYGRKGLWKLADLWFNYQEEKWVKGFDRFVVLTEEDKRYWGELANIIVIPNARTFSSDKRADLQSKKVIAVGRYTYQKGFERLIEIWSLISQDFPDWKLEIIGDGEEKSCLEYLIKQYDLCDSLLLVSTNNEIKKHYLNSSIYVLTSRYEGLPMVLLEAQACGLPIVSFRCKCGPEDIVDNGITGFLIDEGDIQGFAESLRLLMGDVDMRESMGKEALKNSANFSQECIMKYWTELFNSLVRK